MGFFDRLKYAAFLMVATVMIVGMSGLIFGIDLIHVLFDPLFGLGAFLVAFVVAPWVQRRLPFKRK